MPRLSDRREFLRVGAVSLTASLSPWFRQLAAAAGPNPKRKRSLVLLWLNGGPSTIDLWDLKPGQKKGGPFTPAKTAAPGLSISEHLPKLAGWGDRLAVIRSMATKEGDHGRASYLLRTGQLPQGAIRYPTLGALVSKELGDESAELPNFVSIAPQRFFNTEAYGPGFLGPRYAPLIVGESTNFGAPQAGNVDSVLTVQNLRRPNAVGVDHAAARDEMLRQLQEEFAATRPGAVTASHLAAYDRATRLMSSEAAKAFDLTTESDTIRDRYGRNLFGQGCLLARRLVEHGVPFVEVTLGGWDTHQNNFDQVKNLSGLLDAGWSTLFEDLKQRGLLETTTIVCMGEFGRTPVINPSKGRDHYPNAWSAVLAGGGVRGGQAYGKTSVDGTTIESEPTSTADFLATVCRAIGIDPEKQNLSNVARPIRIVDGGQPIQEVLS